MSLIFLRLENENEKWLCRVRGVNCMLWVWFWAQGEMVSKESHSLSACKSPRGELLMCWRCSEVYVFSIVSPWFHSHPINPSSYPPPAQFPYMLQPQGSANLLRQKNSTAGLKMPLESCFHHLRWVKSLGDACFSGAGLGWVLDLYCRSFSMAVNIRDVSKVGMNLLGGSGPGGLNTFLNSSKDARSPWPEEFV